MYCSGTVVLTIIDILKPTYVMELSLFHLERLERVSTIFEWRASENSGKIR